MEYVLVICDIQSSSVVLMQICVSSGQYKVFSLYADNRDECSCKPIHRMGFEPIIIALK